MAYEDVFEGHSEFPESQPNESVEEFLNMKFQNKDDVKKLQVLLNRGCWIEPDESEHGSGCGSLAEDGIFGHYTELALMGFLGMSITGDDKQSMKIIEGIKRSLDESSIIDGFKKSDNIYEMGK